MRALSGIISISINASQQPPPATEEEMMAEIFKYTERVVNMIRPRKLLFMAIGQFATPGSLV